MKKTAIFSIAVMMLFGMAASSFGADNLTCWFPPGWKTKAKQAKAITDALSEKSGISVQPRIAKSYPQILTAFSSGKPALVYVGSFVQAIIHARGIGTPLVQSVNGKELYAGILIYPKGKDPEAILKNSPEKVAFALGASSGESSAKAATGGKASFPTPNHNATAGAVKAGKAEAGVVKNWWWEKNKQKFPKLDSYMIPGVSEIKNPDNVLTASKSVPDEVGKKIIDAAIAAKDTFGADQMVPFDASRLQFSLTLMKQGNIDPLGYKWN